MFVLNITYQYYHNSKGNVIDNAKKCLLYSVKKSVRSIRKFYNKNWVPKNVIQY